MWLAHATWKETKIEKSKYYKMNIVYVPHLDNVNSYTEELREVVECEPIVNSTECKFPDIGVM